MNKRGFTLIELMIVIAIIAIIASIALPNLIESRKHANQASAIGGLHAIIITQQEIHDSGTYPCIQCTVSGSKQPGARYVCATDPEFLKQLAAFTPEPTQPLIVNKSGYCFGTRWAWQNALDGLHHEEVQWIAVAWPRSVGNSGEYEYVTNHTGTIYSRIDPNTLAWNDFFGHLNNNGIIRTVAPFDCTILTPPYSPIGK